MYHDDVKLNPLKDITEKFNSYFLNIGKQITEHTAPVNVSFDSFLTGNELPNSLFLKPTSTHEILKIVSSLNASKSGGPDGIDPKVIKKSIFCFVEPLCYIFNTSVCT